MRARPDASTGSEELTVDRACLAAIFLADWDNSRRRRAAERTRIAAVFLAGALAAITKLNDVRRVMIVVAHHHASTLGGMKPPTQAWPLIAPERQT